MGIATNMIMRGSIFFALFLAISFILVGCGSGDGSIGRADDSSLKNVSAPRENDITIYLVTGVRDDGSLFSIASLNYIPASASDDDLLGEGFHIQAGNQNFLLSKNADVFGTGSSGYSLQQDYSSSSELTEFASLHSSEFKILEIGSAPNTGWPKSPSALVDFSRPFPALENGRGVLSNCSSSGSALTWMRPLNAKGKIRISTPSAISSQSFAEDVGDEALASFRPAFSSPLFTGVFSREEIARVQERDPVTQQFGFYQKNIPLYLERAVRSDAARISTNGARIDNIHFQIYVIEYVQNWKLRLQGGCGS